MRTATQHIISFGSCVRCCMLDTMALFHCEMKGQRIKEVHIVRGDYHEYINNLRPDFSEIGK